MAGSNFADVVKFSAVSAGTGSFVVSGAITGYQTPATAGAVTATQYSYRAESSDLTQWEVGQGTYTGSSTTLSRTPLFNNVGGSSAINFTLAPNVGFVALAEDLFTAVTKAQQQTGTSVVNTVTPAQQQSHDSAAKAWAYVTNNGTATLQVSYNVTSISRPSTGTVIFTFTVPFAAASYATIGTGTGAGATADGASPPTSSNTQTITTRSGANVTTDLDFCVAFYGRQ